VAGIGIEDLSEPEQSAERQEKEVYRKEKILTCDRRRSGESQP